MSAALLIREKALVVHWESVRAIIGRDQAMLFSMICSTVPN